VRGLVGFISLSCTYYAVVHLPLAEATVIQYTNPVFTALLAAPVLGEALHASEVLLAAVGLSGVLIVARPPFLRGAEAGLDPLAVSVGLVGALFSAGAYVMVRRLRREEPLLIVFYFALVSALGSAPAVIASFVLPRGPEWGVLLAVGVTTHLGQVFLTLGLRRERAGRATAVGYLQIVFATLWGVLFFAEVPDLWTFAGAAVIVVSTVALSRLHHAPPPTSATP
jgi:drug/metabolite transporter (DMT)-like permease